MSIGLGGTACIAAQDEKTVIYQYGAYNLNDIRYRNAEHICDGIILIAKKCLVEPDIHTKIKKINGHKKLIVKRIVTDGISFTELYDNGQIWIENCSHCWKTLYDDKDFVAWQLVWMIFRKYQQDGCLPKTISYHV